MTRLRRLDSREVLRSLGRFGFEVASTQGSHAKLVRILPSGERQVLVVPLHKRLASGTVRAIYRQALRYVAEAELRPAFFRQLDPAKTRQPLDGSATVARANALAVPD